MRPRINGVDGATGLYLEAPAEIAGAADARQTAKAQRLERGVLGLPYDVDPLEPETTGWAIVAHESEAADVFAALEPLFVSRRRRFGERVQRLAYSGQGRARWLASFGVADSDVDPEKVPYYLLLAGSSAKLPFELAHDLAVDYAVGRLELDSMKDYRRYAERIVEHEEGRGGSTARRVAFFGPRHPFGDDATELSADHLLTPLADGPRAATNRNGFGRTRDIGATATKAKLVEILREQDGVRPAVLFTASHGVAFAADDPRQRSRQGALLCQDWKGVGSIDEASYFAASDVPADANVGGLVAFHFACYSVGTPERDRFFRIPGGQPRTLASQAFTSALPKELLRRGALAVVGHVDRAWGYSIVSPDGAGQALAFDNFLGHLMRGEPVGQAMRDFADRYARFSVSLTTALDEAERNDVQVDPDELLRLWTQRNDAGSYMILGDPLVRLRPKAATKDGDGDA